MTPPPMSPYFYSLGMILTQSRDPYLHALAISIADEERWRSAPKVIGLKVVK